MAELERSVTDAARLEVKAPPARAAAVASGRPKAQGASVAVADEAEWLPGTVLIGRPVVEQSRGERIGAVQDVIYDPSQRCLIGFRLQREGPFGPQRVLDFRHVARVDEGAIVIKTGDAVVEENQWSEVSQVISRGALVVGRRLLTESGDDLGAVRDVRIDRRTGLVATYELASGTLARDRRPQGVGREQTAGESGAIVADALPPLREGDLVGRVSARELRDDAGNRIVAAGERVTASHVAAARRDGKLALLSLAVADAASAASPEVFVIPDDDATADLEEEDDVDWIFR